MIINKTSKSQIPFKLRKVNTAQSNNCKAWRGWFPYFHYFATRLLRAAHLRLGRWTTALLLSMFMPLLMSQLISTCINSTNCIQLLYYTLSLLCTITYFGWPSLRNNELRPPPPNYDLSLSWGKAKSWDKRRQWISLHFRFWFNFIS